MHAANFRVMGYWLVWELVGSVQLLQLVRQGTNEVSVALQSRCAPQC